MFSKRTPLKESKIRYSSPRKSVGSSKKLNKAKMRSPIYYGPVSSPYKIHSIPYSEKSYFSETISNIPRSKFVLSPSYSHLEDSFEIKNNKHFKDHMKSKMIRTMRSRDFNHIYGIKRGSCDWPGDFLDDNVTKNGVPCYYYNKNALEKACKVRNIKITYLDNRDNKHRKKTKAQLCHDLQTYGIEFDKNNRYNVPEWFKNVELSNHSKSLWKLSNVDNYRSDYSRFKSSDLWKNTSAEYKKSLPNGKYNPYSPSIDNSLMNHQLLVSNFYDQNKYAYKGKY